MGLDDLMKKRGLKSKTPEYLDENSKYHGKVNVVDAEVESEAEEESAADRARRYKEKDLIGAKDYPKLAKENNEKFQQSYNDAKEYQSLEYMNIKEARDKKSALEEELEELENLAKEQVGEAGTAAIVAAGIRNRKNSVDALVDADNLKKRKALEKEISDLAKDIILASRIQQGKYVTKRATEASDFEKFSQEAPEEKKVETIAPHAQNIKREDSAVKYMSEQQRAIYNYYLNKFGKKKAEEYLDIIRDDLNLEQAKAIYSGNEDKVLNQLLIQAASGFEQAKSGFQGTARAFLGDESNQPVTTSEYLSQMADEDLADFIKLPSWVTNITGWESVGQIAGDAIKTTTNMIPSIAAGMATGGIGGALAIGASSGGNSYNEAIREGFSIEQARNYAVLTGISETTLSYILGGIGALGGKAAHKFLGKKILNIDGALKKVARVIPTNYIAEGAEEYLQEILNPIFRNLIFEEDNEIDLLSPDAIASFILGGLSSVGFSVGETVYANYEAKQTYKDKESMDALIESGLESADDTVAHKLAAIAKEKIESGKNLSGGEIRKLENANEEAIAKEQERAQEDAGVVVAKNATVDSAEPKTASAKAETAPRDSILVYKGKTARDVADIEKIAASFEHATKDTPGQIASMYSPKDNLSPDEFIRGAEEAYRFGTYSYPISHMEAEGTFSKNLPSAKRLQSYYIGKNNAEQAIIDSAKETQSRVLPGVKGRVVYESGVAAQKMSFVQKATIGFVEAVSKATGMEYHIFASYVQKKDFTYTNRNGEVVELKKGERVFVNSDGEVVHAANGWYDPVKHQIWMDVNAGSKGQGIGLYTITHEHVHDIRVWSSEHYNKLAEITAAAFERSGKSFEEAVARKLAQYRKTHPETTLEVAREEVIAETMSGLLRDKKGLTEFSNQVYKQDRTLWEKIKDWFKDVIAKITNAYKNLAPESEEARMLMEQKELFEEAQKVFAEAVATAGQNYRAHSESFKDLVKTTEGNSDVYRDKNGAVIAISENGNENNIKYNIGEYRDSGRTILENWLNSKDKKTGKAKVSKTTRDQILKAMDDAVKLVEELEKQIPIFKEWGEVGITVDDSGKPVMRCKVKNGEYEINFDFSTVCKKRKGLDAVLNELIKSGKINLLDLSKSDIQFINETLDKHHFEIACGLCFVDSKRYRVGEWANNAAAMYNDLVLSLVKPENITKINSFNFGKNSEETAVEGDISTWDDSLLDFSTIDNILATKSRAEGMGYKKAFAKLIKNNPKYRKFLTSSDIISSAGSDNMRNTASDLLAAVNAVGGTSKPKMSFSESIWDHSILIDNRITPKAAFAMGGARTQSFSDFIATMFFDYCQMFAEAQAKGLPMQAYTKELSFAKLFGLTGLRLNLSVLHGVKISAEDRAWLDSMYKLNKETGQTELKIGTAEANLERYNRIRENAGLDENGDYVYEKQSIDFDESVNLQNTEGYSRYIGTIVVGISEKHIWKLLDDIRARMIIPYHKSGLSPVIAKARNIDCYNDFTKHQNTRFGESWGKDAGKTKGAKELLDTTKTRLAEMKENGEMWDFYSVLHEYEKDWDTSTNSWKKGSGHAETITYEMESNGISTFRNDPMRQTCADYLAWCEKYDMIPQFEQFIKHPNYYKMQEDFDVYDCITGEYVPQAAVEFRLPDNAGEVLLEELKVQQETSDRLDAEMSEMVDTIIKERGRKIPPEIDIGIRRQERDSEYMDAVKKGDIGTMRKLVEEAAKDAGYTTRVLHGTNQYGFTKPDVSKSDDKISFFATDSEEVAQTYSSVDGVREIADDRFTEEKYDEAYEKAVKAMEDAKNALFNAVEIIFPYTLDFMSLSDYVDQLANDMALGNMTDLEVDSELYEYIEPALWNAWNYANNRDGDREFGDADYDEWSESREADRIWGAQSDLSNKIADYAKVREMDGLEDLGNYDLYANTENFLEIDAKGNRWNQIPFDEYDTTGFRPIVNTRQLARYAWVEGYGGVKISNVFDDGGRGKYQTKPATVYIFFDPQEQVKSADPVTKDDDGNVIPLSERFKESNPDIRYSLRDVEPVQPSSDKWKRTATTSEVMARFPDLWNVAAEESETRNPTQITGTVRSYRKIYDFLKNEGFNGKILDASSGLGYGTRAGIEEYGFDVEDIEPYPDKSYRPKYKDYSKLHKKYDVIISNAVLNVIPQEQRDALVVKMGELLNEGGRMFINVRGKDVENASSKVAINEDLMEYYISSTGSYQKGFTKPELVAYLQDALGSGYDVKATNMFGAVSAVVTKKTEDVGVKYSLRGDYWKPVLDKDEWRIVNYVVENHQGVELTDTADYFYRNYKGKKIFGIYSTVDNALLYAVHEDNADKAYNYLKQYREEYRNGNESFTGTEKSDSRLKSIWLQRNARNGNNGIFGQSGKSGGNASIYGGESGIYADRALRNVLKNLFEERQFDEGRINYQERLSVEDRNRVEILENKVKRLEGELKKMEADAVLAGQMSQGKAMAKEMRHKAEAYEKAIAKKKEQISEVRARRDELLEKARKEKADAVAKVRQEARDRLEKTIADVKAEKNAQIDALREKHIGKETAIKEKYRDSIKKATEGRHRTLLRGKIKRVVNELNTLLTRQTKEKHVPLELQKPVAEALSILNLDDQSYYESRIKSLESQIADAKTSEQSHILQEELNKVLDHRQSFKDKLEGLRKAYEAIEKSADPYIKLGYDSNIAAMIDRVGKDIGDTYLRDMSMTQLEEVYDLYKAVLKTVRDANKFFADEHGASVVQSGFNVIDEIEHGGKTIDEISRGKLNRKKFYWNNLKPVYAFKKLGSKTLEGLFDGVLKGQGTWAKDITEAKTFFERTANKYDYKTWNKKQSFEFTSNTGKTFSLNLQQMMSLYAYSKRDQAYKHLTDGGFVFDNHETIKRKYVVNTAKAYNISVETLQQIIGKLSSDQMHFVDEMQKYLSETMGEKGNEISRAMYDINLFGESEYFPLKSAKQFTFDRNEVTSETKKLVNSGFTKPIQPGANNPIILTGFMDVWANHVNDMSMYHAFVLPIENFNKVYNFQMGRSEDYDSKSVKSTIQSTFTSAANDYIEQLIKDINGGARTDSREGTYKKLIGNWKKAAVFASASVVIQQPSAIGRAFAEINAKYFVMPTKVSSYNHKKAWEQIKKYAPVAVIKEMGYFDTDMGQSTADYIKGDKTFMDKADDLLSFAPAVADEYTWSWIWDAVKRETKAKHIDLNVNSEEFLNIAGERFTEIIDRTQVYDSVLSRSGNMRSKGLFMQMLTAFMAEPTTSANMAYQAMLEAKAGHKKKAMAYIGSVGTSVILNTVLVSLIYAMRDDDDDERFEEKYTEAFVKELIDGINPLTYIPFIKDVMSIFQGWDVERVDMSLIADLYDNLDKTIGKFKDLAEGIRDGSLSEEEIKASFEEILKEYSLPVLDTLASIVGVPFKNIRRDIVSIFSTYDTFKAHEDLPRSDRFFWDIVHEAAFDQLPFGQYGMESKDDKLFDALSSGDDDYLERLKKGYSSEDAYSNAIRAVIKNGFISGEFGESQSKTFLMNYGGKKLDDAEGIIKSWSFEKKWGFAWSDRADAYATGQISKTRLEKAVTDYTGKTGEDAQKEVDKIVFKSNYGFDYSDRRNEYFDGNITKKQLKKALMDVDGKTSEEADMQIKLYDLQKEGFTEVTEYAVKDYYEFCEPAGIPEDVYFGFFEETKDIKGDYDSKGESIPYSKTKKIMPYINKLPLTAKQKTAIAKSFGWADSTIRKYRLW